MEDRIRRAEAAGLHNLPCHPFDANAAWLEIILAATDLVAWTKLIGTATVLVHPFRCLLLSSSVTARHTQQQQDFDSVLVGSPPSSGELGVQTFNLATHRFVVA